MTINDSIWMQHVLREKALEGPVLELGVGYGGATSRRLIEAANLRYYGTDLEKTPVVDFAANFERREDMDVFSSVAPFGTVLILNVLEHTFDPIRVLDHAFSLLYPGGKCAVLTPSIWPLHNYPMDAWRILPNFYEEYSRRRGYTLERKFFQYAGVGAVDDFRAKDGSYEYPPPCSGKFRLLYSRIVHKLFKTCGRAMFHASHVAIGAIIQKPIV